MQFNLDNVPNCVMITVSDYTYILIYAGVWQIYVLY